MSWTPERTARLVELWQKGWSIRMIAWALRTTRSAVAGKIDRLHLTRKLAK